MDSKISFDCSQAKIKKLNLDHLEKGRPIEDTYFEKLARFGKAYGYTPTEDAEFEVIDSKLHKPERNEYIIGLDTANGKARDYSVSSNWRIKKCHTDSNGNTVIDEAELIDISILG